jgi:acetyltransferase
LKVHGTNVGEFAIVIGDAWQGQGVGSELLQRLIQIARDEKLSRLRANMTTENAAMQAVCKKLGFSIERGTAEPAVRVSLDL